MARYTLAAALALATLGANLPARAASLSVRFSWAGVPACSHVPPGFHVTGVPPGTAALRFTLHDLQVPDYPAWRRHHPLRRPPRNPARRLPLHRPVPAAGRAARLSLDRPGARRLGPDPRRSQRRTAVPTGLNPGLVIAPGLAYLVI